MRPVPPTTVCEGTQVRRAAGESVIHRWNRHAAIYCFASRLQPEVEIHSMIDRMAVGRIGGRQAGKVFKIDLDAVGFLLGRCAEVSERREALPVLGPRLLQGRTAEAGAGLCVLPRKPDQSAGE